MKQLRRTLAWCLAVPFVGIAGPLTIVFLMTALLMVFIWVISVAFMLATVHAVDPSLMNRTMKESERENMPLWERVE